MLLSEASRGGERQLPSEGDCIVWCVGYIDYGDQIVEYQGQKKKQHKVKLLFESSEENKNHGDKGEVPLIFGKTFTFSVSENANFIKFLQSWRGKPFVPSDFEGENAFSITKLIGVPADVQIVHKTLPNGSEKYADIQSPRMPRKALMDNVRPMQSEPVQFDLHPDRYDQKVFEKLSRFERNKIMLSPQWQFLKGKGVAFEVQDEEDQPEADDSYDERNPPPATEAPSGIEDDDIPF